MHSGRGGAPTRVGLRPEALLFDLGGVVIDVDFQRAFDDWARHAACEPSEISAKFAFDEVFRRHERGEISESEYFSSLRTSLDLPLSEAQLVDGWNAVLIGEIPGISNLLTEAAKHYRIYAFSNSNRTHQAYFSSSFGDVLDHFEEIFVSSSIGLRKPDPKAFRHVQSAIGVAPERVMFFDDLLENVEGARAANLQATHVASHNNLVAALAPLLG